MISSTPSFEEKPSKYKTNSLQMIQRKILYSFLLNKPVRKLIMISIMKNESLTKLKDSNPLWVQLSLKNEIAIGKIMRLATNIANIIMSQQNLNFFKIQIKLIDLNNLNWLFLAKIDLTLQFKMSINILREVKLNINIIDSQ